MTPRPEQIAQLASGRVLVVGDVMLDHYVSGSVTRVSDEAPVPIIRVDDERWTAGGAANVAANVAALGGRFDLAGIIGDDGDGRRLAEILGRLAPEAANHLIIDAVRPTVTKTRYMGGQHQIVRVDRERALPIGREAERALAASLEALVKTARVVILSDYAKGALSDIVLAAALSAAKKTGALVLVDPKRANWSAYKGAAYITPNRKELQTATGLPCETDEACARAAEAAMNETGAAILLTRSEKGMSLYRPGVAPLHLPARAREVFDVSGAGDTAAAAVGLALASGLSIETSVAIANLAAGIVVGKRGTATASPAELTAELGERFGDGVAGALPLAQVKEMRRRWGRQGQTVGFTNGCFDLIHPGHVSLLRQAAAACDRLIVALNTDASVARLKGPGRPVQSEAARAAVMAAIKGVDAVILFDEETPLNAIGELEPDVLVKGADYAEDKIVGADIVKARGGRVVRAQLVEGQSTTKIVEKTAAKG